MAKKSVLYVCVCTITPTYLKASCHSKGTRGNDWAAASGRNLAGWQYASARLHSNGSSAIGPERSCEFRRPVERSPERPHPLYHRAVASESPKTTTTQALLEYLLSAFCISPVMPAANRSTDIQPESKLEFNLHTSPDGRPKSRGSIDSHRNKRSALSFPSFRGLGVMLGRPRKFKSANAGLLD